MDARRDGPQAGLRLATLLDAPERARALSDWLERAGGWRGVYLLGPEALVEVAGPGAAGRVEALFGLVDAWLGGPHLSDAVDGPEALAEALRPRLALEPVESFWVVSLDARSRVVGLERVAVGTLTACLVHPREVFAAAVRARAASVVVLHNHPSGDPEPSHEDLVLTERLADAGRLLGIPLVDHVVVAHSGIRSLLGPVAA